MTADKRTSRYHFRGGSTEVVRLDAKLVKASPGVRSEKRPIPHATLESGEMARGESARMAVEQGEASSEQSAQNEREKRESAISKRDPASEKRVSPPPPPERITSAAPRSEQARHSRDSHSMDQLAAQLLDDILRSEPTAVDPLIPRVEKLFDHLVPHYTQRFPGPLWVDLRGPRTEPPRGSLVSAMSACLVAIGERSVPVVLNLLRSPRSDQRFCAALVARELPFEPIPSALVDLALHDDPSSRLAAALVLPEISHARGHAAAVEILRRLVRDARETTIRVRAVQALEELRDAGSVAALVGLLGAADPELVEAARSALLTITAASNSRLGWWLWLRTHQYEPRFAWLRAAMEQGDEVHGAIAKRELVRLLGRVALDGSEQEVAHNAVERRSKRRSWP